MEEPTDSEAWMLGNANLLSFYDEAEAAPSPQPARDCIEDFVDTALPGKTTMLGCTPLDGVMVPRRAKTTSFKKHPLAWQRLADAVLGSSAAGNSNSKPQSHNQSRDHSCKRSHSCSSSSCVDDESDSDYDPDSSASCFGSSDDDEEPRRRQQRSSTAGSKKQRTATDAAAAAPVPRVVPSRGLFPDMVRMLTAAAATAGGRAGLGEGQQQHPSLFKPTGRLPPRSPGRPAAAAAATGGRGRHPLIPPPPAFSQRQVGTFSPLMQSPAAWSSLPSSQPGSGNNHSSSSSNLPYGPAAAAAGYGSFGAGPVSSSMAMMGTNNHQQLVYRAAGHNSHSNLLYRPAAEFGLATGAGPGSNMMMSSNRDMEAALPMMIPGIQHGGAGFVAVGAHHQQPQQHNWQQQAWHQLNNQLSYTSWNQADTARILSGVQGVASLDTHGSELQAQVLQRADVLLATDAAAPGQDW